MLEWSLLSDEEVVRQSKCNVYTVKDLDSPKFGRAFPKDKCHWCHMCTECPGHWGHMNLPFPVTHPITGKSTVVIAVAPLNIRPPPMTSISVKHALSKQYAALLRATTPEQCQARVDAIFKRSKFEPSLADRFRGKKGRMRANIMGRRVNNSARSVITGDPSLHEYQVGVPHSIADELTVQVRVNDYNRWKVDSQMREDTDNGRHWVKDGFLLEEPTFPQVGDMFFRPLRNGDLVVLNRQPTLHQNSMVAMEVVRVPYSTIRINPRVTKGFNADFDGDEMNLFAIQTLEARAEAECLMHIKHHSKYIVDIQDSKLARFLGIDSNALRLRGHSVHIPRALDIPTCSLRENVHEFKNKVLERVRDVEPKDSPWRHMVESKSKGNWSNICAIRGCLGQQFMQGKRPDKLHEWAEDTREERGFVHSSYVKGLSTKEFFFHCMAGREGLIDTAIRTADVGYKHRRIARFLEELQVKIDGTVRDEYSNVVQWTCESEPYTNVGLIAAQKIGEPATQLTLNTFHSSGAISEITTSGLSRMQELLQWSKKNKICMRKGKPTGHPGEHWIMRETTLNTFKVRTVGKRVYLSLDTILRYDTDVIHIAKICGATAHSEPWCEEPWVDLPDTRDFHSHISGRSGCTSASVHGDVLSFTSTSPWEQHEYSTNPVEVCAKLGIEAARTVWVNQMKQVLPQVNDKYIELLGEYMCHGGKPNNCSRKAFLSTNTMRSAAYERAQTVFPLAGKHKVRERICTHAERIAFNGCIDPYEPVTMIHA